MRKRSVDWPRPGRRSSPNKCKRSWKRRTDMNRAAIGQPVNHTSSRGQPHPAAVVCPRRLGHPRTATSSLATLQEPTVLSDGGVTSRRMSTSRPPWSAMRYHGDGTQDFVATVSAEGGDHAARARLGHLHRQCGSTGTIQLYGWDTLRCVPRPRWQSGGVHPDRPSGSVVRVRTAGNGQSGGRLTRCPALRATRSMRRRTQYAGSHRACSGPFGRFVRGSGQSRS